MGKGRHRAGFKEEKDGETQKLRNTIRRLQSDIKKLKSELKTYEAAFQKNITFLKGKVKDHSLHELLKAASKDQNLQELEVEKEETFEQMAKKWQCHKCNEGVMKLTVVTRQDGKWYFRKCTISKCTNRTDLKQLTDDVEIS